MREIVLKAYAKVNLNLDITGVREDGYHLVDMVMQQIDLYDWVSIREGKNGISLKMSKHGLPTDDRNLAYRAAELILKNTKKNISGVNIYIHKYIPIAAGMAGGSTDAAAVLVGMNEFFGLGFSVDELCDMGVKLGADVPFCIRGGCMRARGIGEVLEGIKSMPDCYLCIAKPDFGISTREAYRKYDSLTECVHPDMDSLLKALDEQSLDKLVASMGNVLETVALLDYPVIREIEDDMRACGALGAVMTGSGPTVFGIFDDENKAAFARDSIFSSRKGKQVYVVKPVRNSNDRQS